MDVLVQTKFMLPPNPPQLVPRQHLVDRLNDAAQQRLILVSAPAGFGKTTIVTTWLHQLTHDVAWLALDELDDDPLRFWRYITAALGRVIPVLEQQQTDWFNAPDATVSRTLPALLINVLATLPQRLTLILDDYHLLVDPVIHHGVDFLLDHLPAQMQLVLLSRTDPPLALPRLRARHQLCELRTTDLRFLPEESRRFLRERMALDLDEADIQTLEARTEGWVAALQFTGLSLQKLVNLDERQHFIRELTGRDRYVVDYLLTEVLDRQPSALQQFLLQTSILERLSASLCNTLLERNDAQQILSDLERANLFLIPLDNERHWYRYHHLFAELLRERLTQSVTVAEKITLHRRAHQWYAAQEMIDAAVEHALAAGDYETAAALVLPQIYTTDQGWRPNAFLRVRRWVDQLPEEVLLRYPRLAYVGLGANLSVYRADQMERYLQILASKQALPADVQALFMGIQANLLRIQGHAEAAKTRLQEAMTIAPEEDLYAQMSVKEQMAILLYEFEDAAAGTQLLHEVVDLSKVIGHHFTGLITAGFLGLLTIGQGKLRQAALIIERELARAEQQQIEVTASTSLLYIGLSILHYEWNDLTRAAEYCDRGLAQSEQVEMGDMLWQGYQMQAQLALQRGDTEQLNGLIQKVDGLLTKITATPMTVHLRRHYGTFVADIALRQGNWDVVAEWVRQNQLSLDVIEPDRCYFYELLVRFTLDVKHASATQFNNELLAFPQIVSLLERLIHYMDNRGLRHSTIRLQGLLAKAHWLLGDPAQAYDLIEKTLTMAAPEGYIRIFIDEGRLMQMLLLAYHKRHIDQQAVDGSQTSPEVQPYLKQLLAAFAQEPLLTNKPKPATDTIIDSANALNLNYTPNPGAETFIEPLTGREAEVLHLVVDGFTNQEIANELVISIATVKRHISNIYGKLGVTHRTQAVARAQSLQIV